MELVDGIRNRRSIRSFKSDPVPREILEEVLDISRWAPSGGNVQPWHIVMLGGEVLDKVKVRLDEAGRAGWNGTTFTGTHPDFPRKGGYPEALTPRADSLRKQMDTSVFSKEGGNISERRGEFWLKMLRFFEAPNAIILCSFDTNPTATSSIGIMSQTICLAAHALGLGTCIMGLPVGWPEIYRELLGLSEDKRIATSIAIGYPDLEAPVNNFPRPRESLDVLTEWHGVEANSISAR